jgi:hypothetical protein
LAHVPLYGDTNKHGDVDSPPMNTLLKKGTVTDTLIRSTEDQGDATHVLVILYTKKENGGYGLNVDSNEDMTVETANWLCDKVKAWLIQEVE